jgi:CubicO group peptidase (beta-lactamase class C family)
VRTFQQVHRVPAVAAGVRHRDAVADVAVVGWADVAGLRTAGSATQFRIGSITKTFTAAVVIGLALGGEIDLDEPAERYLPAVDLGRVRIRQLLAHSGGVQREVPGSMWSSMQGPNAAELAAALAEARPVDRPGMRWHYSNLGYAVLGQVVAAVTGVACEKVIDDTLLRPLGLAATTWAPDPDAARGYRHDPYRDTVHREPVMDQGAVGVGGQLWSTIGDVLAWGAALAGAAPHILPTATTDLMHTLHVVTDTAAWTAGWGLGLALNRHGDRIVSGHTGAMPGFAAALSIDRPTRTVTAALANLTRGANVAGLAADLLDHADTGAPPSDNQALATPWQPGPPCPPEVDGILGRWWCEAEETIFTWRAGHLHAHLAAAPTTTDATFDVLGPDHYQAARGRLRGEHLTVVRDGDGTVGQLTWATYPYTRTPR